MASRIDIAERFPTLEAREVSDVSDIRQLAEWLDTKFAIPGANIRFGLDNILGLFPGIGDGLSALMGLYILNRARDLGAPPLLLARMGWNIALDVLVGSIPLLGDIFDVVFRSNTKNVRLLMQHLEKTGR